MGNGKYRTTITFTDVWRHNQNRWEAWQILRNIKLPNGNTMSLTVSDFIAQSQGICRYCLRENCVCKSKAQGSSSQYKRSAAAAFQERAANRRAKLAQASGTAVPGPSPPPGAHPPHGGAGPSAQPSMIIHPEARTPDGNGSA